MRLLPISALSTWTHCPRQFFLSYVLCIKEPMNKAMALGILKHKFHELASEEEQPLVSSLTASTPLPQTLRTHYLRILRNAIITSGSTLKSVGVPIADAVASATPLVDFETQAQTQRIEPFIRNGLFGQDLWHALTPKIKTEYSIHSKTLGLKGRIDRLECYSDRLVPIELKSGITPPEGVFPTHRIQAASYALLLEEQFGSAVPEAIVHYIDSGTRRPVVLNPFLREQIVELAKTIRLVLETRELPRGCANDTCTACTQCNDPLFVKNRLEQVKTSPKP